jgi:hypothetical protein
MAKVKFVSKNKSYSYVRKIQYIELFNFLKNKETKSSLSFKVIISIKSIFNIFILIFVNFNY